MVTQTANAGCNLEASLEPDLNRPLTWVEPEPHLRIVGGVGVLWHGGELEGAVEKVLQRLALPDDGSVAHAHEAAVAL